MKQITLQTENINKDDPTDQPAPTGIVETHWLRDERKPGSFAQEAAAAVLGNGWMPPEDFDFRDREPPHIPAPAASQDSDDIVADLRKRRAA